MGLLVGHWSRGWRISYPRSSTWIHAPTEVYWMKITWKTDSCRTTLSLHAASLYQRCLASSLYALDCYFWRLSFYSTLDRCLGIASIDVVCVSFRQDLVLLESLIASDYWCFRRPFLHFYDCKINNVSDKVFSLNFIKIPGNVWEL